MGEHEWQLIETAPTPTDDPVTQWIIGYVSWGFPLKEHTGPCEWVRSLKQWNFVNHDFDAFPLPRYWHPWPAPPPAGLGSEREGSMSEHRQPRYTEQEVEAAMIPKIVEAIYPVLIPVEQQDCAIQERNHARMKELATELWRSFVARPPALPKD